jgi:AcrR family transcriptional regulator
MAMVITQAGLSAGAVYGHFRSKTELIHAVAEDILGSATGRLQELANGPAVAGPDEVYSALLTSALEVHGQDTPRIAVQVWAELARDDDLRDIAGHHLTRLRDVLAALLARCQRAGTLPPGDPSKMARTVLALVPGYALQQVVYQDVTPDDYLLGAGALFGDRARTNDTASGRSLA